MNIILLDCIFGASIKACMTTSRYDLTKKFRISYMRKSQFSTDSDREEEFRTRKNSREEEEESPESRIQKLLNKASPLRPELGGFWGTNPYSKGTIYQDLEILEQNISASETSIILFPGQGNQFVGMAKNLLKYPVAVHMFEAASEILNYDLLKVCNEGPEEKLNATEYCQPATLVCSLALLEKLKDEKPWAISNCVGTCGYSLGELAALSFAGCFSFENAVRLVKVRAKAMELCSKMYPGGMLTVFYGPNSNLSQALSDAVTHCKSKDIENPCCSVASYLFPNCKVIAGNVDALNFLINNSHKYGIRKTSKLNVSGAFHSSLMKDAVEPFQKKLFDMEVKDPIIHVYSSATGKKYNNASYIKKFLPKQICLPVKWQQVLNFIYERDKGKEFPVTYECGPGYSLTISLRKVNAQASKTCFPVKL